jgi:hypothetical protein
MTTATEATMEAINQHMTQMTAVATNTSMKLNALSDLNLPLGGSWTAWQTYRRQLSASWIG